MAPVQTATGATSAASGNTSVPVTFGAGVGAGNLVTALVEMSGAPVITPPAGFVLVATSADNHMVLYYLPNATGGVTTYTWSFVATTAIAIIMNEWFGPYVLGSTVLDQQTITQQTGVTAVAGTTTGVTTQAAELWYVGCGVNHANLDTFSSITAGFTDSLNHADSTNGAPNAHCHDFYEIAAATGAVAFSATASSAGNFHTVIATFRIMASPGAVAMVGNGALVESAAQVVAPGTLAGNGVLSESSAQVLAPAALVGNGALVEATAQVLANGAALVANGALVESSAVVLVSGQSLAGNAALGASAQLVANGAALIANGALAQGSAQVRGNGATLAGSGALALAGAQVVAVAALIGQGVLSGTGSIILGVGVPGTVALSDSAVGLATLSDSAVGVVTLSDSPAE